MDSQSLVVERGVSIRGEFVVKTQAPEASRRERLRTLAGRKVGLETGLFVVPEIVSFDDRSGEIVFQRLHLPALRDALSDRSISMEIAGQAARALAAIHDRMEAIEGAISTRAGEMGITAARVRVPLHGDFGVTNVRYLPHTAQIAVIDWSNADWIEVDADLGAPEIDVAVFLRSLFHRSLLSRTPALHRRRVARHFLATYASSSSHGLHLGSLTAVLAATSPTFKRLTRRWHGKFRWLGYRHGMLDLQFFLRRLATEAWAQPTEHHAR